MFNEVGHLFMRVKLFVLKRTLGYLEAYLEKHKSTAFAPRPGGADFSPFKRMTRRLCALVVLKVRQRNKADRIKLGLKIAQLREAFQKTE